MTIEDDKWCTKRNKTNKGKSTHGVVVDKMDCNIVVRKLQLQCRKYFHFQTYILEKSMNSLILPAMVG